jgi:hypothetical protein
MKEGFLNEIFFLLKSDAEVKQRSQLIYGSDSSEDGLSAVWLKAGPSGRQLC